MKKLKRIIGWLIFFLPVWIALIWLYANSGFLAVVFFFTLPTLVFVWLAASMYFIIPKIFD